MSSYVHSRLLPTNEMLIFRILSIYSATFMKQKIVIRVTLIVSDGTRIWQQAQKIHSCVTAQLLDMQGVKEKGTDDSLFFYLSFRSAIGKFENPKDIIQALRVGSHEKAGRTK